MDDVRPLGRAETVPTALWAIVLVALSPFPVAALAHGFGPETWARPALTVLLTWSAVTLAYLGGVRWGLESGEPQPRPLRLILSVGSALAACAVLLLRGRLEDAWILGGFLAVFLIQWLSDHQAPDTPSRYPRLSTAVTAAACVSLALALEKILVA